MNIHPRIPRETRHLPVPKPRQANPDTDLGPQQSGKREGTRAEPTSTCALAEGALKLGDFSKNPQLHRYVTKPNSPTL